MTLQKETGDPVAAEISVHGYVRGDDLPASGVNPLEILLGPKWCEQNMILDFSRVTEMGSAGLGWLLMTHRTLKSKGMKLAVHSVKPLVAQQFKLMSVNRVVMVADDRAAAVAAMAAGGTEPAKGTP